MNSLRLFFISFFLICIPFIGISQVVYYDITKSNVYEFLDELANLQVIELNTLIKPYSRALIAEKLKGIDQSKLNKRQLKELEFYLKDFNKELLADKNFDKRYDLFYYKDSLFTITLNPVLGGSVLTSTKGTSYHRRSGAEVFGSVQGKWGFYMTLHDNYDKELLQNENFINKEPGVIYKSSGDYSDLRAGLSYSWNWGSISLLKDNYTWGNQNFGANIIANKAPSFARVELKINPVHWLDFTYYHGWLASEVRDSSRIYPTGVKLRNVDVKKYIAANVVTIRPIPKLNVSLGNSIVYSDILQPAFLIPFAFFKSIDHTVYAGSGNYGGQNTQIFLDLSSRNIQGIHLYSSLYIDEISFTRMWNKDRHSNFISWKFGAQKSNLFNKNISLAAEYTRTNPITYQHFVETTTYASNQYNFGHYLGDNAQEIAFQIQYKPIAKLKLEMIYTRAEKGPEYEYTGTDESIYGLPFLEKLEWKNTDLQLDLSYEVVNDALVFANYRIRDVSGSEQDAYTPEFYQGQTQTVVLGCTIGF